MAVYDKTDVLQKWRYVTKSIQLLIPGEDAITIPKERLQGMSLYHDYDVNAFPIFKIELVLESSLYYKIIKHKDDIQFHLRIQSYYYKQGDDTPSIRRDVINDTYDLILDDESEDLRSNTVENKGYKNVVNNDENDLFMTDNKIEFFLFKSDIIKGLKKTINQILTNASITDAIAYILTVANIKNVIMSPSHNINKYSQLLIPPLSCIDALRFIDTYYGIYKTGSMMYFDLDRSYIISYDGKCSAYEKGEITKTYVIIPKRTSSHSTECGMLVKRGNTSINYVVADYNTISIRNDSISNDVINSNDIQFIDNYSGDVTSTLSGAKTKGSNSFKIKENITENQWLGNTYVAQSNANDVVIDFRVMDFDTRIFKPNKKYNMVFEDSSLKEKYNGVYIISSASHEFIKEGLDFAVSSVIRLRKVKA